MKFKELSNNDKDKIISMHSCGETAITISANYDVSARSVGDWLRKLGMKTGFQDLPQEKIDIIIKQYCSGKSMYHLAKKFHVSVFIIKKYLHQNSIKPRTKIETLRKYSINEHYFDSVDTEEKAYWLGFIFADGYCRRQLIIQLQERDKRHLERFLQSIRSTHSIKNVSNKQVRLAISNKHISRTLTRFPITPKSLLTFPSISPELICHFIRGYNDGDGGFYFYKPQTFIFCITTNNYDFLLSIYKILVSKCSINLNLPSPTWQRSLSIRWAGEKQVRQIFNYLYENATLWLPRKREGIEQHFN